MKKTIKVKTNPDTGESYFDIEDFKDIVDIDKVQWYNVEENGDGSMTITFYDKDKKQIKPKQEG